MRTRSTTNRTHVVLVLKGVTDDDGARRPTQRRQFGGGFGDEAKKAVVGTRRNALPGLPDGTI